MLKPLVAFALLAAPAPSVAPVTPDTPLLEPVPLVACGDAAGSAFRIGPKLLLSVNHVTRLRGCTIDGEPEHVTYKSPKADFTMLADDRAGKWIPVDCGGFIPGHHYIAIGHARGLDDIVGVNLMATGAYEDGMSVLIGVFTAQPGQSGGPIVDADTLKVVGTVNAANWEDGTTFSVELKGTPVCGGDIA